MLVEAVISNTHPLSISLLLASLGYAVSLYLIPRMGPAFIRVGFSGRDLSKKDKPLLPETIGVIPALVYLVLMVMFIPFVFYRFLVTTSGGGGRDGVLVTGTLADRFPHIRLSEYLSSVLCLQLTVLLGLADDLFDLRWRHKFFLPAIAAIPLLVVYYVDFGVTSILVPAFFRPYLGGASLVDVGMWYYVYMGAVAIFLPNSINILAGINGLEVGQLIVVALVLLVNDACYIFTTPRPAAYMTHLFSACLLIPFVGVLVALLRFNWCPARVFVGDTYCYFAGMVFAVVGILGHFSKTLLLFLVVQIANFVYSVPQLFHLVPCPRHRLPRFNEKDGLMYPSYADFTDKDGKVVGAVATAPVQTVFKVLERCGLVHTKRRDGVVVGCNNLTLINLALVWRGPMTEDRLCMLLMAVQLVLGLACVVVRHLAAAWLFGYDNLWQN